MPTFKLNYIHYLLLIFVIAVFALLFLLTNNKDESLGEPMIIDNLTSESNQRWVFFTDRVMGGISSGSLKLIEEEGDKFYKMTGDVSTKNNGGFIQFRADLRGMNLKENDFEGLRLLVRGNGENYNIHIRTGRTFMPWQYYSVEFKTSKDWNEIIIPFSNFKRSNFYQPKNFNSKDIATLGIVAYGKDYKADIDLAKIEFY